MIQARAVLAGTGICVPPLKVDNPMLSRIIETSDEWVRERSGVVTRYYVERGVASSDLGAEAARAALADAAGRVCAGRAGSPPPARAGGGPGGRPRVGEGPQRGSPPPSPPPPPRTPPARAPAPGSGRGGACGRCRLSNEKAPFVTP